MQQQTCLTPGSDLDGEHERKANGSGSLRPGRPGAGAVWRWGSRVSTAARAYKGLRSPICWYGGKGQLVRYLVDLVPSEYSYYCEPFFGGGSMFFRLAPARVETINDLNSDVMALYRVLRDAGSFERFYRLAEFTIHSRELFQECQQTLQLEADPVVRAWKFWVITRQAWGGDMNTHGWKYSVEHHRREMSKETMALIAAIDALPAVHQRLRRVQIECADARQVIESYARPECLLYVDPPYHLDTRSQHGRYDNEMSPDQHADLVEMLARTDALVMVSGYEHETYAELERAGWDRWGLNVACLAEPMGGVTGRRMRQRRTEVVWRNYVNDGERVVRLETVRDLTVSRPWRVLQQPALFDAATMALDTAAGTE